MAGVDAGVVVASRALIPLGGAVFVMRGPVGGATLAVQNVTVWPGTTAVDALVASIPSLPFLYVSIFNPVGPVYFASVRKGSSAGCTNSPVTSKTFVLIVRYSQSVMCVLAQRIAHGHEQKHELPVNRDVLSPSNRDGSCTGFPLNGSPSFQQTTPSCTVPSFCTGATTIAPFHAGSLGATCDIGNTIFVFSVCVLFCGRGKTAMSNTFRSMLHFLSNALTREAPPCHFPQQDAVRRRRCKSRACPRSGDGG